MSYRHEARTGAGYYLYLPQDYVESEGRRPENQKWPVVVSFHGMRPWDSAGAQIMEWQQEADRYGYVVIAPTTRVSDLLGSLPIKRVSRSLKADERDTLAILDELTTHYDIDPNHVLSTSWSMGGYLAHYMLNRHPDRFSCLAVRQSNFSAEILNQANVPAYRDTKVAVFNTKNDFAICKRESKQAVSWYTDRGFDITSGMIDHLGHERTPETAAAFFAMTCGAEPKTPPTQLSMRITKNSAAGHETLATSDVTAVADKRKTAARPPRREQVVARRDTRQSAPPRQVPDDSLGSRALASANTDVSNPVPAEWGVSRRPSSSSDRPSPRPAKARRLGQDTPAPPVIRRPASPANSPLIVRLSAYIGIAPMLVSYTVQIPSAMMNGARVVWYDNGEPISEGISGQKSLSTPGQHRIEAIITTSANEEVRAVKTVTVLDRLTFEE